MASALLGTFDDLVNITPEHLREIVRDLRAVITAIYPASCEVVRLGDRAATYGVGPKKMTEGFVYIMPHKSWVNLGFYKGADLTDPDGILEGTGTKLRHIKIRSSHEAQTDAVQVLIRAAVAERLQALGVRG